MSYARLFYAPIVGYAAGAMPVPGGDKKQEMGDGGSDRH